ncbi:MAG: alpha-N-arabinofuranosidase [Prevotella sp.]|nr:alpha-N-arabinofuranosidase [Prevotella sp.]
MRKLCVMGAALLLTSLGMDAQKPMKAPAGGKLISDELLGIFFEDISSSADGGLWAELLQNGSFEYNANERDGWGPATAWRVIRPGHSLGYIAPVTCSKPSSGFTAPYSSDTHIRLHVERVKEFYDYAGWKGFGLQNDGFGGIVVKQGQRYDFSMRMANMSSQAMQVRIALVEPQGWGKDPKLLADTILSVQPDAVMSGGGKCTHYASSLREHTATLTPDADCSKAALQLLVLNEGDVVLDDVSLMPQDTYKGHGLRRDLAEALEALKPKFMRFPGGCVVHGGGDGFWNTYRWKNTIGPRHERKQQKNTWGYHQSMGLGYYEYFQMCEDMQMQALPILPCGVSCQGTNGGWNMKTQAQDVVPMNEMDEWVQDALDLIEWANGDPATSEWAAKRAAQGHPAPFGLKYLGIGNEEKITPEFCERFRYMYKKVSAAHPEIIIVGTAGPGSHPGNPDYDNGWQLADELQMPIMDEHYYEPNRYFLESRQYDNYPRDRKTKVYLGEYAAKDKKLIDALAEGLYLLHVERNGDVVCMTSYAPLFAKKGATNWNPDLIYFDNERPYLTCSYYVQQLFGRSAGQYYYADCVSFDGDEPGIVQPVEKSLYGQSVVLNVKTRKLYVKLCNAGGEAKSANVNLSRFSLKGNATKTTISGQPNDENNFEQQPVTLQTEIIKAKKKFTFELAPYTMTMLEYAL